MALSLFYIWADRDRKWQSQPPLQVPAPAGSPVPEPPAHNRQPALRPRVRGVPTPPWTRQFLSFSPLFLPAHPPRSLEGTTFKGSDTLRRLRRTPFCPVIDNPEAGSTERKEWGIVCRRVGTIATNEATSRPLHVSQVKWQVCGSMRC